jgi:hypothetical protein
MARRRPTGRDWQQRAFEESEYHRLDRTVGIPEDLPNELSEDADRPRRSIWRWVLLGFVLLFAFTLIHARLTSRPPALTTNCSTPAIALSSSTASQGSIVRWSATGPANMHFVLLIGVSHLVPGAQPGQLHPVPDRTNGNDVTRFAARPTAMPSDCKANGEFSVNVPAGQYPVTMFRLDGTGANVTGTQVAVKPLTVTS